MVVQSWDRGENKAKKKKKKKKKKKYGHYLNKDTLPCNDNSATICIKVNKLA